MKRIKTICFLTRGGVNHDFGGLDRVTELLADFFEEKGYVVYYLSQIKRPNTHVIRQFYLPDETKLLSKENKKFYNSFITEKKIDVLINQEGNVNITLPLNSENNSIIYLTALHFNPNYITEFHFINKFNKMHIPNTLKFFFLKIFEISFINKMAFKYLHRKLEQNYYINCLNSDQFVLLSSRFYNNFSNLFKTKKTPINVTAIGNPIKLKNINIDLAKKKKQLLYVGRLECGMKQIDRLLKNWNALSNDFPDWSIHIVGGGPDEKILKQQVEKDSIPRVFFEGIQNPQKFYEDASIFCFSSSTAEGWGMVLVEAQECGCVPIAFSSYAAINDIITHRENGILVDAFDDNKYQIELSELMKNEFKRNEMAENTIQSVKKFSIDEIGNQWIQLIEKFNI